MKLIPVLAAAAVLALAPVTTTLALDYRVASEGPDGLGMLDADDIVVVGTNRRIKVTVVFPPSTGKPPVVMVAAILVDCNASRYRIESLDIFDARLVALAHEGGDDWSVAEQDSPFTPSADFACRGKTLPRPESQDLQSIVDGYLGRVSPGSAT